MNSSPNVDNPTLPDPLPLLQTRLHILFLQHPQEPDHALGTAQLAHKCLPNSTLRIGLSWPNLSKALGKTAIPARWAVLYLGSGLQGPKVSQNALQFVSKKGQAILMPARSELDGLVVLDGSWSQAKTLWWRNAWLLKLKRAILIPQQRSLYAHRRKEPRAECLSTLEAVAEALVSLQEPPEVASQLYDVFREFLKRTDSTSQKTPSKPHKS